VRVWAAASGEAEGRTTGFDEDGVQGLGDGMLDMRSGAVVHRCERGVVLPVLSARAIG